MPVNQNLFGERSEPQTSKRQCLTCRFFRFVRLIQWCGHPLNNRPVKRPLKGCKHWIDRDQKGGMPLRVPLQFSLGKAKNA